MTDTYEFSRSNLPQGLDMISPYVSKQWGFVNDINSQNYTNNGVSLVQLDLGSIFNSSAFVDPAQMYIAVPLTLVSAYVSSNTAGTTVAPTAANAAWAVHGLKNGYWNLVHGADVTINGKTIDQFVPNLNCFINFKMLSQFSQDDLKTLGSTLGFSALDNPESMRYNPSASQTGTAAAFSSAGATNALTAGFTSGNGIVNNQPFPVGSATADGGDQGAQATQFTGAYNNGFYARIKKYSDTTNNTFQNFFGATAGTGSAATTLMTTTQIQNEFKPYTVISGNYIITYDVAVIRLCDILDCFKQLPLTKKLDCTLRLYMNTGTVASALSTLAAGSQMCSSGAYNSFTNTCPLIQSGLTNIPATATGLVSGLYIYKPPTTSYFGVNFANSGAAHAMTSVRCYFPSITLKPEKIPAYLSENHAKKIVYSSVLFNTFNNISSGATFSGLVQAGVSNIRGVLVLPFVSNTIYGAANAAAITGVSTFSQFQSPFDTAPATNAPLSLINLQVMVGGVNQLMNTLNYSFENFYEQVTMYEKINQSNLGISCGLIDEYYWNNGYRAYYVDVSRGNLSDMMESRNVNVSFTNNTNVNLDVMVFVEYYQSLEIDVETGLITK